MSEIEIIKSITFYGFAIFIVLFALLSFLANKIIYSLLFVVIVFFSVGGIFFSLGADYNAVIQISVYGVALPILFLFAIFYTSSAEDKKIYITLSPRFFIAFISISVLFMILWYSISFNLNLSDSLSWLFTRNIVHISSIESFMAISKGLYEKSFLSFELFSFLLFIVVVGITTFNIVKEKKHD